MEYDAESYPITLQEFKDYFEGEFNFNTLKDSQILLMFEEASAQISSCLLRSKSYKFAYMNLVAFLLYDKYGNGFGMTGSKGTLGIISSESQDDQSISYAIPEKFLKSPLWSMFSQNPYGLKYLRLVYPCTIGNVSIALGGSTIR